MSGLEFVIPLCDLVWGLGLEMGSGLDLDSGFGRGLGFGTLGYFKS